MTDLERKLEEIAEKFYKSDCQCDECIRELVQAATQATARYCAEIAEKSYKSKNLADRSPRHIGQAILRECGVKE